MVTLVRRILLFGLWFALLGNGVALASPVCGMAHHSGAGAADCAKVAMPRANEVKQSAPACLAMVAGTVALTPGEWLPTTAPIVAGGAMIARPSVRGLDGRVLAPEPEPPATHG